MIHLRKKNGGMRNYPSRKIYRNSTLDDIREIGYMDISIDNKKAGRITFELFNERVPRTCGNFIELISHKHRFGYKGSAFFRITPGFMCQGGDWLKNNGSSSNSVFARNFLDENFKVKHDQPGILSMANKGPDTNGSQFFITFKEAPWLDGKNVAFGRVTEGFDVLKKIEKCGSKDGVPTKRVVITRCDEIFREYYGQMEDVFGKTEKPNALKRSQRAKKNNNGFKSANVPTNMRNQEMNTKNMRSAPKNQQDYTLPQV